MKKTLQISIAKTLFTIEEDAYILLERYLESLKGHFSNTKGKDEIIGDIESRIAEQLDESGEKIITESTVKNIIDRMGEVEDFETVGEKSKTDNNNSSNTRKLYRNTDDVIVGGVASGIATFFGVDPVVVRLLFVLLTLASGFGIVLYIVLWIILPAAKSTSQKLEMKGEKITLDSLAQNVKNRVDEIRNNDQSTLRKIIAFPFIIIGKVIHFIIKVLGPTLRVFFGSVLIIFPSVLLAGIMIAFGGIATGNILIDDLIPLSSILPLTQSIVVFLGFLFTVLIPILFILFTGVWVLRKKPAIHNQIVLSLLGVWFIALFVSGFGIIKITSNYENIVNNNPAYNETTATIPLSGTFQKLDIREGGNLTLIQGTTTELKVIGRQKDIHRMEAKIENDTLIIDRKSSLNNFCFLCFNNKSELFLTVPDLSRIQLKSGSHINSANFTTDTLDISLSMGSSADMTVTTDSLVTEIKEGSHLIVHGKSREVNANVDFGSQFSGRDFQVSTAEIISRYGSIADVFAIDSLKATANYGSEIMYRGGATIIKNSLNGSNIYEVNSDVINSSIPPLFPIPSIE